MKWCVIINKDARSVPENAQIIFQKSIDTLEDTFLCKTVEASALHAAVAKAVSASYDGFIIWGGDGTIACLLSQLKTDKPVIPLPGGTMNLLPKSVHGDLDDWETCLHSALKYRNVKPITFATANGHPFYVAVLLGNLTRMSQSREALRKGAIIEAAQELTDAEVWDFEPTLELIDTTTHKIIETSVAIAAILPEEGNEGIHFAGINPSSLLEFTELGLAAWWSGWRNTKEITRIRKQSAIVYESKNGAIQGTLDGEACEFSSPIKIVRQKNKGKFWAAISC